jgi:phosphohistidine swiveling domain-containing protein
VRKLLSELTTGEVDELVKAGDVVVAHDLRIEQVGVFKECAGIVTAEANLLSHAAIQARESRIPAVGGVVNALELLREGEQVTVDGDRGLIHAVRSDDDPSPQSSPANDETYFYNPTTMRSLTVGDLSLVYEMTADGSIHAFPDRLPDRLAVEDLAEALSGRLSLPRERVIIDRHTLWPGGLGPTFVYDQFSTEQQLKQEPEYAKALDEAALIAQDLDLEALEQFVHRVHRNAGEHLASGRASWNKFKRTGGQQHAEDAAREFDKARVLDGALLGVVLESYCMAALSRATDDIRRRTRYRLSQLLASSDAGAYTAIEHQLPENERERFEKVMSFWHALERSRDGVLAEFSVLVDEFSEAGLASLVEKYQW